MTRRPRHYDDPCGIARALNLIAERWALLVVRELVHGPKRFTDLRTGLPGVSPNVLSQRLDDLTERGIVRQRHLGPPVSADVYELTTLGMALEPVLLALATWGSRAAPPDPGVLSDDAFMLALRTTCDPDRTCPDGSYRIDLGTDVFTFDVTGVDLASTRGTRPDPIATIEGSGDAIRSVVFGGRPLDDALAAGDIEIGGDIDAGRDFLHLFDRPQLIESE